MKKFISSLLCLTMIFCIIGSMTVFAESGKTTYFTENVIEGHTTNDVTASKDLLIYKNNTDGTEGQVTVTAVSGTNDTVRDAEVVDVDDIATAYPSVAAGAVGKKLIKYTQGGDYGMLRLQNWIPARTYKEGETVTIGMRVYMTDTYANMTATETSAIDTLETRLTFCVGTAQKTELTNSYPATATNKWVTISRTVTLTAAQATTLNSGNVGMRFDFVKSAVSTDIAEQPYAGTVFFDDVFYLEVTGSESTELVEGSVNEHTTNDVTKSKDLFIYKTTSDENTKCVMVTALGQEEDGYVSHDAEVVAVGDIAAAYPEVAEGAHGRKLIKYTQGSAVGMLRMKNWTEARTYAAGETVQVSLRLFCTDMSDATVTALDTRVVMNLDGTDYYGCMNNKQSVKTGEWVTLSSTATLTEDQATALNNKSVGMRFDFYNATGANNSGKAYAGTVFFDDEFSVEVIGDYTDNFASWTQTVDANNGSLFLDKGADSANGRITFTSAGTPTKLEGLAMPKSSYKKVMVSEVKDAYAAVATGHNDDDLLIRVTQNGNMFMNRMINAVEQGIFKEGEIVEVSFNVFLADPKSAAATETAPAADSDAATLTGRVALRNDASDVAWSNVEIPVGKWTTVTKRFRIAADQTAVHGFRFDLGGEAHTTKFNTPFAATIFFDGNWSLKKVTNVHNTSEHSIVTSDNTITVGFNGTNVQSDATMGIAAAYDADGRFLGAEIANLNYGDTTGVTVSITVEDATKVADVKLFLFDENIKPLQVVTDLQ